MGKTALGNWIRINNGKVEYKLDNGGSAAIGRDVGTLTASDHIQDEFVYAIRLGNGTLSQARVTIDIQGRNDGATITSSATEDNSVTEAGGVANASAGDPIASGQLTVHDVDSGENHFATPSPASLIGTYGTFTFNPPRGRGATRSTSARPFR